MASFAIVFEPVFQMVTVFASTMFHIVQFCSPVMPYVLRFNSRCGQIIT